MKRFMCMFLAIVMVIISMTACGTSSIDQSTADGKESSSNSETDSRTIVDLVGDEVEIPAEVHTVVNLVPFG